MSDTFSSLLQKALPVEPNLFNMDCLKLVSATFYQISILHQMIALQKL